MPETHETMSETDGKSLRVFGSRLDDMCGQLKTLTSELVKLSRNFSEAGFSRMDELKRSIDGLRAAVHSMMTETRPECGTGENEEDPDSTTTSDPDDFEWLVIERTDATGATWRGAALALSSVGGVVGKKADLWISTPMCLGPWRSYIRTLSTGMFTKKN